MPTSKEIGDKVSRKMRKTKKRTVQVASDVDTESEPVSETLFSSENIRSKENFFD